MTSLRGIMLGMYFSPLLAYAFHFDDGDPSKANGRSKSHNIILNFDSKQYLKRTFHPACHFYGGDPSKANRRSKSHNIGSALMFGAFSIILCASKKTSSFIKWDWVSNGILPSSGRQFGVGRALKIADTFVRMTSLRENVIDDYIIHTRVSFRRRRPKQSERAQQIT